VTLPSLRGAIVSGALLTSRGWLASSVQLLVSGISPVELRQRHLYLCQINEGQIEAANAIAIVLALFSFLIFSVLFSLELARC